MRWIALALLAVAAVDWVFAWVRRVTTELAVTSRRVIFKAGVVRRTTFEINRSQVETVVVSQGIFGRILNYGRVEIIGTGATATPMPLIDDPLRFRSHITAG